MSAVSNKVMPRSMALWITLREVSRSVRWPKLLQPRPTADTRRPEPPRLRICMIDPEGMKARRDAHSGRRAARPQGAMAPRHRMADQTKGTKKRPRSDAATDGDRLGRVICDGGPD